MRRLRNTARLKFDGSDQIAQPEGDNAFYIFPPERQFYERSRQEIRPTAAQIAERDCRSTHAVDCDDQVAFADARERRRRSVHDRNDSECAMLTIDP